MARRAYYRPVVITACAAALLLSGAPAAHAIELTTIPVRQPGDTLMSCEELWNEAYAMRAVIAHTRAMQEDTKLQGRGIGAAGAVASFLVGTATGGIGIAAAGFAAKEMTEQNAEEAEQLQETAQQRRALMAGIFMVKDCPGPIENALQDSKPRRPQDVVIAAINPEAGDDTAAPGANTANDNSASPNSRTAGTLPVGKPAPAGAAPPARKKADYNP